MVWILTFPLWSPMALFILYVLWVQSERGGWWRVFNLVRIIGEPFDVFCQYTVANLWFWEISFREPTISARIGRLMADTGWRGHWARLIAHHLNALAPSGKHI